MIQNHYRGKQGLLLLELKANKSFKAYTSNDYGSYLFQRGVWQYSKGNLHFITTWEEKNNPDKDIRGSLLKDATYKVSYSKNENICLLYTSPSPRDKRQSRMPSSA